MTFGLSSKRPTHAASHGRRSQGGVDQVERISRHRLQVRIRCQHRALSLRQPHDGGVGDCDRCPGLGAMMQSQTDQCRRTCPGGVWSPGQLANCPRQFCKSGSSLLSRNDARARVPNQRHPTQSEACLVCSRGRVDALESDLAVENQDGPVEVVAMTDDAPEEFEGRLQMGRRVVLVIQSADGLHVPISMKPILSKRMHSKETVSQPYQPLDHWVMRQRHQTPRQSGESQICRSATVQFPRQNLCEWWRKCPWVQHFGTHHVG